ncbi:MAG: S-layer homology domain-containing protein [Ruminococcaceae bacterium]|nr:S-layer homology domain-containing protein [Oscillospiraceae bacterium]
MKKARFIILLCIISTLLCVSALAKTHKTDIVTVDTIEYTLEEEDRLSAELFVDEDGLYEVKLLSLSTSGNFAPKISIKVFDGNKEIYSFVTDKKRNIEGTEPESYGFLLGLFEGEYKLEIENLTKFSDVTFKLETTFTENENIETFGNSSFENASKLSLNEKYFGGAVMSDEVDYFGFDMPYDGVAYIQMYTPKAKFFTLYDSEKNEIGSIGIEIEEADKVYELRSGLAKGKYYISVQPDEDYSDALYTVEVNTTQGDFFEKEYNNAKVCAMPLESGKEYQGNIFGIHDIDNYTFTLSEKSNVTIDFTDTIASNDNHYKITLSSGDYKEEFEGGRVKKLLNLDKGTYHFTVKNLDKDSFTSMIYKIKLSSDKGFAENISEENKEEVGQFNDVSEEKWYYDELLEAKRLGLINGVGDNKYNPEENVTLAEIIAMAARIKNAKGGINTELTSSPVGKWYNSYITFAVNSGIIKPDDFESFEENATRAQVAYIFSNLFSDIDTEKNTIIPDVNKNTQYCDSIHKMYALGILKGGSDGLFRPEDKITRAEAAAILLRVHNS